MIVRSLALMTRTGDGRLRKKYQYVTVVLGTFVMKFVWKASSSEEEEE